MSGVSAFAVYQASKKNNISGVQKNKKKGASGKRNLKNGKICKKTGKNIKKNDVNKKKMVFFVEEIKKCITNKEENECTSGICVKFPETKKSQIKNKKTKKEGTVKPLKLNKSKKEQDVNECPTFITPDAVPQLNQITSNSTYENGFVENISDSELSSVSDDSDNKYEENAYTNAQKIFTWIINPIRLADFFTNYWEQKPVHIQRDNPKYFSHILTSNSLDSMLRENPLYFTKNVDIVSYEGGVRETHNPEGRAVPSVVWDFYANGCSVRILNPQSYNKKIHVLVTELQELFGTMVGVNLYLTPRGSQGFAPHYDDIEAFVIQLEGRKHWKLYMPSNESEFLARFSSKNLNEKELGKCIMEITVNPGDVLYFPRGIVHQARTDEDSHSLHLTISTYQRTSYADLLENALPEAIRIACENHKEFREGLPLHYLKHLGEVNKNCDTELRREVLGKVSELVSKLFTSDAVDYGADMLGKKFMYDSMPPVPYKNEKERTCNEDGDRLQNGEVINRVEFEPDTEVRLLRNYCMRLVKEEDKYLIYYSTHNPNVYHAEEEKFLSIDECFVEVIKVLQCSYPEYVTIEDLPGDDIEKKITVVSDLWEFGLIVTKNYLPVID